MNRPVCPACNQRHCAVNYNKNNVTHYRSRCGYCISKGRKIKPAKARWELSGYKKKPVCDRCGFRSKYSAQLRVYHIDGNLHNSDFRNLKTVCLNCCEEISRANLPWRAGDLQPDF